MPKYIVKVQRYMELFYEADSAEEAVDMAEGETNALIAEYMEEDGSTALFFQFEASEVK